MSFRVRVLLFVGIIVAAVFFGLVAGWDGGEIFVASLAGVVLFIVASRRG